MRLKAFLFFLSVLPIFSAFSEPQSRLKVEKVSDGDSLQLSTVEGLRIRARLVGVDCPEMGYRGKSGKYNKAAQPGAEKARDELERRLKQTFRLERVGEDRYQRQLVEIFDSENRSVNEGLVQGGFCEAYRGKIQKDEQRFREAERQARSEKRGIWGMANYESPALFRKRNLK